MKKSLLVLLPVLSGLVLTGCNGGGEEPTSSNPTSAPTSQPTSTPTSSPISQPTSVPTSLPSPTSTGNTSANPTSAPTSAPTSTPTSAAPETPKDAFIKARNNTVGKDVAGFEYDYTLEVSGSYMTYSLSGKTEGNTKYNKSSDVPFYDRHENSGDLFYDGVKYEFKKDGQIHEISLDKEGFINKYTRKAASEDFLVDSSSFAKALFEYDDSKIKSVEKTNNANEYELKTGFNATKAISLIGNYVNHPMVERIIGSLPETSVTTKMLVTFASEVLNTYKYSMVIDVADVKFSLSYDLTFKHSATAPAIDAKTFNDVAVTSEGIASAKNEIQGYLDNYKALEHSSYDFVAKTAVDYAKKNAINATVDGFTKRKVSSGESFYLNDYEVDTDHKNADLYKDKGLKDCHGGRAKLSTGEVHDLEKKLLGGYKDLGVVTHNDVDNYYLLDILGSLSNVIFIQKVTDSTKNMITYAIGGDEASTVSVLNYFNNNLRLNPVGECSVDVKAFGEFTASSVSVKQFKFNIVITNGALSNIKVVTNGSIVASFPGSRDFQTANDAGFKLDYKLTVTDKGSSYEPASEVSKVK